MYLLTKIEDELNFILSPDETLRIGDTLKIDEVVAQVIDVRFADLPGVLEHILRKSLIPKSQIKKQIQPEVKNIIDSLADQKLAIAKIRGRIEEVTGKNGEKRRIFRTGLSEFKLSRTKANIELLSQIDLFEALGLKFTNTDFGKTITTESNDFDVLPNRLGINLITGMKGSGKSYSAKRLLLKLIDKGVLTLVFDLNGEYLNLWRSGPNNHNEYHDRIRVLTPNLRRAQMNEIPFLIPLNEISYDDFARFLNVEQGKPMYQFLLQFWRQRSGTQFDLNDLDAFVNNPENIANDAVRIGLQGRVEAARALGLFGPSDLRNLIINEARTGGAIIINLSRTNIWEREIIVEFILRQLALLGGVR